MLGAIIGDIVGSRFEWNNNRSKEFDFLTYKCFPTDDSIMSLAIAQAILVSKPDYSDLSKNAVECMQSVGRNYPNCGYGGGFYRWMFSGNPQPYNSYGNGAAMRVSAAGFVAESLEEAKKISKLVTEVTHNHPEGIKGAKATAAAIFLARTGKSKKEIRNYIESVYHYDLDKSMKDIISKGHGEEICQISVPQALVCFLLSDSYIDTIRKAVSIGGDSDTIACIAGSIAEAFYGMDEEYIEETMKRLPDDLKDIVTAFEGYRKNRVE